MSERKRLSDADYERDLKRLGDSDVGADEGAMLVEALESDHLQAREDVKRLAPALRLRVMGCCGKYAEGNRCAKCVSDLALLTEVDPE